MDNSHFSSPKKNLFSSWPSAIPISKFQANRNAFDSHFGKPAREAFGYSIAPTLLGRFDYEAALRESLNGSIRNYRFRLGKEFSRHRSRPASTRAEISCGSSWPSQAQTDSVSRERNQFPRQANPTEPTTTLIATEPGTGRSAITNRTSVKRKTALGFAIASTPFWRNDRN